MHIQSPLPPRFFVAVLHQICWISLLMTVGFVSRSQTFDSQNGPTPYNPDAIVSSTLSVDDLCTGSSVMASWSNPTVDFTVSCTSVCVRIETDGNCQCNPVTLQCCWAGITNGTQWPLDEPWSRGANWSTYRCLTKGDYTLTIDVCNGTTVTITPVNIPCGATCP